MTNSTSSYPPSIQVYLPSTRTARRSSICPEHNKRTSEWRGIQESMDGQQHLWAFRCSSRNGHIFLALPDPSAPTGFTREEAADWVIAQTTETPTQH